MDRMTDRERYRTLGAYFLGPGLSYKEAIDNYTKLVASYPTDRAGEHNLALAYFQALDLPQAIAHGRRAVDIYPKDTRARNNLALYLMYSGDFKSAVEEANTVLQQNPAQYKAYLPLAAAAFASSDLAAARGVYDRMAKVGTAARVDGESRSRGPGDVRGQVGGGGDDPAGRPGGGREVEQSCGQVREARSRWRKCAWLKGRTPRRSTAVKEALAIREDATLVPAALVQLKAGRTAEARAIADELAKQFQPRSRAYGALVQADIARSARSSRRGDGHAHAGAEARRPLARPLRSRGDQRRGGPLPGGARRAESVSEASGGRRRRSSSTTCRRCGIWRP